MTNIHATFYGQQSDGNMGQHPQGRWVKRDEHEKIVAHLLKPRKLSDVQADALNRAVEHLSHACYDLFRKVDDDECEICGAPEGQPCDVDCIRLMDENAVRILKQLRDVGA